MYAIAEEYQLFIKKIGLKLLAKIGVKTPVCFIGAFNPRDKSRGNSDKSRGNSDKSRGNSNKSHSALDKSRSNSNKYFVN